MDLHHDRKCETLIRESEAIVKEAKLDINFIRMLQAFAKIEEDPDYHPKKYVIVDDVSQTTALNELRLEDDGARSPNASSARSSRSSNTVSVVLKHPDNVITVASATGKAPPRQIGERRVACLTHAVSVLLDLVESKPGLTGCSIVLYPGMYINPKVAALILTHRVGFPFLLVLSLKHTHLP